MGIYTTLSEAAQELGRQLGVEVNPRLISDMLYQRKLEIRDRPVHGGRRLIPLNLLPSILRILRERAPALMPQSEDHEVAHRPADRGTDPAD